MAAAAITLTDIPAQIECDATGAVITLSTNMPGLHGVLENVGSKAVFVKIKDTAANVPVECSK
jgi:hypothetical protein